LSRSLRIYLSLLLVVLLAWFWFRASAIAEFIYGPNLAGLLGVILLYLCSHLFRMLRLVLLTLDEREKAFPLIAAHALTAFPSSFLPFKIGEMLRLAAFFYVYDRRRKAFAVWLNERFGDMLVISSFIFCLYIFKVNVPPPMHFVLITFLLITAIGLMSLFAVAKVFVYLNRHLVLASHSKRGLTILRFNHVLRQLELDIYNSVKGRFLGLILLSVLIWGIEILALSLFIKQFSIGEPDFAALFVTGLLGSLPGGSAVGASSFGLYQSLALVALILLFSVAYWLTGRFKFLRS
jgi:uncharacterized membrane protein YbhN (UPF0104 family)